MKKVTAMIAALIMLVFAAGAFAETPVRLMYDSVFDLLHDTDNVTLTGHAEFFLNGERFKTADARYIQDGVNSLWDWKLLSPRKDGSERESGYTVIANGETVYVMEVFYPGVYRTGQTYASDSILRSSVQLSLVQDFLRILADQSETLLGKDAIGSVSDENGLTVRIQAGKDVPELVNTALNMAVQLVAKRYFETDYDHVSERFMVPLDNYITLTQAILGSTSYMSLNRADITLKRDAGGNFESAEGTVSVELNMEDNGTHTLDISFRLDVSDRGESRVLPFNPDDYGVKPAEEEWYASGITFPDPETERMILEAAETRWERAGYTVDSSMRGFVRIERMDSDYEDERIFVDYSTEDGSGCLTYFTDQIGQLLGLQNLNGTWQGTYDERHMEVYPDAELVKETEDKLLSWLAEENPELSADVLSLETDWWYQNGDELFLHFWEGGKPVDHAWNEADFIVRVAPEWRIEFFSCIANG